MKYFRNILVISLLIIIRCDSDDSNQHPCFDASLVHEDACTQDCPGFAGCDGNTYCNECEAARLGIGPL